MLRNLAIYTALVVFSAFSSFSQPISYTGTEFWVAFHPSDPAADYILIITADNPCSGTITSNYNSYSKNFTVVPGTETIDTVPHYLCLTNGVTEKGIYIQTDGPVSVVGFNNCTLPLSADTYLALPASTLGTEYYIMSYDNEDVISGTMFSVLATHDTTHVTIYNQGTLQNQESVLHRGQALLVLGGSEDVTGSRVQSDWPVAVFGSNLVCRIPWNCAGAADQIVEQMPPTEAWGQEFYTVSTGGRELDGDIFRILAKDNFTTVKINGNTVATINHGKYYETDLQGMNKIETSGPVLVAQFAKSYECAGSNGMGDPFMMLVPPRQQYGTEFKTPTFIYYTNWVNIIASPNAYGNIYLDGILVSPSLFSEIGNNGYYGARLSLEDGFHELAGSDPFQVFSYGWRGAISYGHPAGGSLSQLSMVSEITLTPDSAYGILNFDTLCFTATVKDNQELPIAGIMVDISVDGMGKILKSLYTDSLGHAYFCYARTGTVPGMDSLFAGVGDIQSNMSKAWWESCMQPVTAGVVGHSQSNCTGFVPDPLVNLANPSGYNGELAFQWQVSNSDSINGFSDIPGATSAGYAPGYIDSTTWFRRLSKVTCCAGWPVNGFSNIIMIAVSNLFTPQVSIFPSANPYCLGSPVTVTASGIHGGPDPVYQWFLNGSAAGSNNDTITWFPSPGDSIHCQFTSSLTCVTVSTVSSGTVTMQPDLSLPAGITLFASKNPFCQGEPITLTASPLNEGANPVFQWRVNGQATGSGGPALSYTPVNGDTVVCILTSDLACVSNNPIASLPVVLEERPVMAGFTVTPLDTTLAYPWITFTDLSSGATYCQIDWGDGTITPCDSVLHMYQSAGTYFIRQTVINDAGCRDSITVQVIIRVVAVEPEYDLFIPGAFTPDNDGLNDIFRINRKEMIGFTLLIFTRTGEEIYSGTDPSGGWNGTFNGRSCPEGVYVYKVTFTDSSTGMKYSRMGTVTLLRTKN